MSATLQTVGIVYKKRSEAAARRAEGAAQWLKTRGVRALSEEACPLAIEGTEKVPASELANLSDMLLVLGGDGTLLYAAGLTDHKKVPILGIHMGSLGFLTPFAESELESALEAALQGKLAVERRMRLLVKLWSGDRLVTRGIAVNDAVVSQATLARLVDVEVSVDGGHIGTYKADGLIISTPTGSTAYSLAAGGPVLLPSIEAFCVTPICPHALTQRPIVLPASVRIAVTLGETAESAYLTIDGQRGHAVTAGDRLEVLRSRWPLLLYRPTGRSFFDILRAKLMWGERVGLGR